eukprot:Phypoly_transcript_13132.p1 GENE.Phypoly_transcript_13132~~Phypoly_transcript_13132.p1  ORF type:complete len:223 (+),score=31.67 Phypoly_transcript_13132:100-669(+)
MTVAAFDVAGMHKIPVILNKPSALSSTESGHFVPNVLLDFPVTGMNIWQRTVSHFVSATTEWFLSYMFNMADQGTRMAKLGPNAHGFFGYRKGAQSAIFFTNTKFGYDVAQPVLPNEILVGPLLDPSPIPPLPPDLANWLDKDKNVVYVNFGTSGYLLPYQLKMLHTALENLIPKPTYGGVTSFCRSKS